MSWKVESTRSFDKNLLPSRLRFVALKCHRRSGCMLQLCSASWWSQVVSYYLPENGCPFVGSIIVNRLFSLLHGDLAHRAPLKIFEKHQCRAEDDLEEDDEQKKLEEAVRRYEKAAGLLSHLPRGSLWAVGLARCFERFQGVSALKEICSYQQSENLNCPFMFQMFSYFAIWGHWRERTHHSFSFIFHLSWGYVECTRPNWKNDDGSYKVPGHTAGWGGMESDFQDFHVHNRGVNKHQNKSITPENSSSRWNIGAMEPTSFLSRESRMTSCEWMRQPCRAQKQRKRKSWSHLATCALDWDHADRHVYAQRGSKCCRWFFLCAKNIFVGSPIRHFWLVTLGGHTHSSFFKAEAIEHILTWFLNMLFSLWRFEGAK